MRSMRLQRFLKAQKLLMKTSESSRFLNSAYFDVILVFWKDKNFQHINIKLISRILMTLKSSVVIYRTLKTSAASLTSAASATSLASTASTALFPQKTSWSWWIDHQWHQKDQYQTFCVEWIIKNSNFYCCIVPFLLEAVEAYLCNFFENWSMKLKFPNLRNILIPSGKM